MKAWLLDLYEDENDGARLWFIGEDGHRFYIRHLMAADFFIYGNPNRLHQCCLMLRNMPGVIHLSRETRRDVFISEPIQVLKVTVDSITHQRNCFQTIKNTFPELTYYNADLTIQVRFAAAYQIFPMAYCDIQYEPETMQLISIVPLSTRWDLSPLSPALRIIEMEPSCDPKKQEPSALKIILRGRFVPIRLDDPELAIKKLNILIAETDPDIIETKWGDDWIFPKLISMEEECGVKLDINRDKERLISWKKETTYFSYGQIVYRAQEVHLFGRCHIDMKNAMMWKNYQLDGTLETARVTAMPIEQAARVSPGSGISAMQMITAIEKDVLVPEQKQQSESAKTALDLIHNDRGGIIYQPRTGLYANVAEIDFVSMYPSIIINANISPEVPLPNGLKPASSKLGIVPLTLKPLYEKRVKLKKSILTFQDKENPLAKSYADRAAALKWLLVVCFGFLGYKNARFGRIEAHEAVTRGGREALLTAKEASEDLGQEVLHMFVDALWIHKPGASTVADFQPVIDEISRRTNMMISLDGIYRWIAFLPSRANDGQPVPNRYFGVFQDGSIKIRGIESRRRDTPPWIAEVQTAMLNCLAKALSIQQLPPYIYQAFNILKNALYDLNSGKVPQDKLILTTHITRNLDEYKVQSASVRAAIQLKQNTGKDTRPGQKIRYLLTNGIPDIYAWENPDPLPDERIDKPKYRELLARAGGTILYPFGIDPDQISQWAAGGVQFKLEDFH